MRRADWTRNWWIDILEAHYAAYMIYDSPGFGELSRDDRNWLHVFELIALHDGTPNWLAQVIRTLTTCHSTHSITLMTPFFRIIQLASTHRMRENMAHCFSHQGATIKPTVRFLTWDPFKLFPFWNCCAQTAISWAGVCHTVGELGAKFEVPRGMLGSRLLLRSLARVFWNQTWKISLRSRVAVK